MGSEIEVCLELLHAMGITWSTARHCHGILNVLLSDLRIQFEEKDSHDTNKQPSTSSGTMNQRTFHSELTHLGQNHLGGSITSNGVSSKRQRTGYKSNRSPYSRGGSGIITPNRHFPLDTTRPTSQFMFQPHQTQIPSASSYQMPAAAGFSDASVAEDFAHNASERHFEGRQQLNYPINGGLFAETGDLFGQVSWESLFQGNGNDVDFAGWDVPNNNRA